MTKLLEKAIDHLRKLPDDEQDRFAGDLLARIKEEAAWDEVVSSPDSQSWLARQAKKVRGEIAAGKTIRIECGEK